MKSDTRALDIVFLGLAQNCEKFLPNFFSTINEISKKKNIRVFLGENGSEDLTFDLIQKNIILNEKINFIDTSFIEEFPDRIKRLSLARQKLKDHLFKTNLNPKFVCVLDLDEVISKNFTIELINNLENILERHKDKYFAVSLKSKPFYYDILNFESDEFPNNNILKIQNRKSIKSYYERKKFVYNVQNSLTKKGEFECISGFNGLCLYLYDDFIKSHYHDNSLNIIPEHLHLNRIIYKSTGKKIFVSCNYLKMPTEHKPINNIFYFLALKLSKYFLIFIKKFKILK